MVSNPAEKKDSQSDVILRGTADRLRWFANQLKKADIEEVNKEVTEIRKFRAPYTGLPPLTYTGIKDDAEYLHLALWWFAQQYLNLDLSNWDYTKQILELLKQVEIEIERLKASEYVKLQIEKEGSGLIQAEFNEEKQQYETINWQDWKTKESMK